MEGIELLKGKVFTKVVNINNDRIVFVVSDDEVYTMYHAQDCCENVSVDDINGDLNDLVGSEILVAEEVSNREFEEAHANTEEGKSQLEYGSLTWTFYKIATIKGYVDIRWYGESNGYYSESVNVRQLVKGDWDYQELN